MSVMRLVLLPLTVIITLMSGCFQESAALKDLVIKSDDANTAYRYWQIEEGGQAYIARARCADAHLPAKPSCDLDERRVPFADFRMELEQYLYADFVPMAEMNIENAKLDVADFKADILAGRGDAANLTLLIEESETAIKGWRSAISFASGMLQKIKDTSTLILDSEIHVVSASNEQYNTLREPLFFVAHAFRRALGEAVDQRLDGVRPLSWYQAGGAVFLTFAATEQAVNANQQLCWAAGAVQALSKEQVQQLGQNLCCIDKPATSLPAFLTDPDGLSLAGVSRCPTNDQCMKLSFAKDAERASMSCQFQADARLVFLGDIESVFGTTLIDASASL